MKKKNRKNKLILTAILGSFALVGVMALSNYQKPQYESAQASIYEQKAVSYDDNNYEITFTADEVSYTFTHLQAWLNNAGTEDSLFLYWKDSRFDSYQSESSILEGTNNEFYYWQGFDSGYENSITFNMNNTGTFSYVEGALSVKTSSTNYSAIKNAIELDIQANQITQGDSIINAVTSGMGLIPDIADEFVKGFSKIFWDSQNNSLTRVSNFMLVMLGIAICMAIIKLCLYLVRNNTGA